MANELYFVPILQEALQDPEPGPALGRALDTIQRLGAQVDYRSGFENFRQFIQEVWSCHDLIGGDQVSELIIELATDASAFDRAQLEAAMKVIDSNPDWKNEYEQLRSQVGLILWEGQLTGRDLLWADAFGPESLELAAETANVQRRPTRRVVLLGGEVILRVFARIEGGEIEVEWVG